MSDTQVISFTFFTGIHKASLTVTWAVLQKTEASCSHAAMSLYDSHVPRWSLVFLGMT